MSELIGRVFSKRYRVLEEIGQGGMSIVYLAEDILLGRPVAIKILRSQYKDDEKNIRFFQNEARSIAALSHPNIVKIYDIGKEDAYYYIVMEYLEGQTLKELIRKEAPLDYLQAIHIIRYVLRALAHSHSKGIIHRDIKPHNIILTQGQKVKVTDFGIARHMGASSVTYGKEMMGSVYYISPEQALANKTSHATDIYSSGVMLYEMLSGQLPFTGDNPVGIALAHAEKEARPLSALNKKIPNSLENIVARAMEKDPEKRYTSALDMARALSEARMLILKKKARPAKKKKKLQRKQTNKTKIEKTKIEKTKIPKKVLVGALAGIFLLASIFGLSLWQNSRYTDLVDVVGLSYDQALVRLEESGLEGRIHKRQIVEDQEENLVLAQKPSPPMSIKKGRTVDLTVSLLAEKSQVPQVVGMTERAATIRLENHHFQVEVVEQADPSSEGRKGQVFKQEPAYPEEARKKSQVTIYVDDGSGKEDVILEDLRGKNLQEAESYLSDRGLIIRDVFYDRSEIYFLGQIMDQSLPAQERVQSGDEIDLTVSRGPGMARQEKEISFTVPGEGESLLTVEVEDHSGIHQEYRGMHQAKEPLILSISFLGPGQARVYQDQRLIMTVDLP